MTVYSKGDYIVHGMLTTVGIALVILTSPLWVPLWALGWFYYNICGIIPDKPDEDDGGME